MHLTLSTAAAGGIEATFVPDAGMLGCSLRHRGEELLGQRGGLDAYVTKRQTMGIPLLYPWANRLGELRFDVAGREVNLERFSPPLRVDGNGLPMHGLLAGVHGWNVERHTPRGDDAVLAARFHFGADEDLLAAFPFPHEVLFEATLRGPTLTITTTVIASRGSPVPISFGYHPYFRLPGVDRAAWDIDVPVNEHLRLDNLMLPTGETMMTRVGGGPLGARTFDDGYVAPADSAPFVLAGGGRKIEVSFGPGYPYAQVFAPAEDDVIAFEPMTAPTNALVSGGPDLPIVASGDSYSAAFSITVSDA